MLKYVIDIYKIKSLFTVK